MWWAWLIFVVVALLIGIATGVIIAGPEPWLPRDKDRGYWDE